MKKYICQYCGLSNLDCFLIMAYDKKEATEKMNQILMTKIVKGKPSLLLLSSFKSKMNGNN